MHIQLCVKGEHQIKGNLILMHAILFLSKMKKLNMIKTHFKTKSNKGKILQYFTRLSFISYWVLINATNIHFWRKIYFMNIWQKSTCEKALIFILNSHSQLNPCSERWLCFVRLRRIMGNNSHEFTVNSGGRLYRKVQFTLLLSILGHVCCPTSNLLVGMLQLH